MRSHPSAGRSIQQAYYDLSVAYEEMLIIESHGGSLVLAEAIPSGKECDATGAAVGRFDPQPVLPESIDESDIVPAPED